ncbi:MAG: fatty acid desaturase [Pseudomonadota bacterium]
MTRPDLSVSQADLRAMIPDRCFQPSTWRSMAYLVFDVAVILLCYMAIANVSVWWLEWPLILLIGTMCWSLFVIGHEAGHGSFSKHRKLNTLIGILTHSAIFVPYRGWQRSHASHHMKTGHLHDEEVFRAHRKEDESLTHKVLFRTGVFVLIGWPLYKLGFRNSAKRDPGKTSHFLPNSDLYTKSVQISWWLGLAAITAFLVIYIGLGVVYGWVFFAKYILAPYLIYAAWLTFVTYMQHVAPEVPVYDREDWTRLKGALATVDRNYGPFNWLTHNIGNLHMIHHLFPTIPHYRLREATDAVRPALEGWYITSNRFVLFDFIRSLRGCHYVETGLGHEYWSSDAKSVKVSKNTEQSAPLPAE